MKISIKVIPRASRNEVVKISEKEYKVRVIAPPVDGKANAIVEKLLAEYFSVPKIKIRIAKGEKGRNKVVEIGEK